MQPGHLPGPADPQNSRSILLIGDGPAVQRQNGDTLHCLPLAAIDAAALADLAPDLAVFALITRQQDAIGVLEHLAAAGYRGACLVLTGDLPNPAAVLAELRATAPGLTIDLAPGLGGDQADGLSRR